MLNLDTKVFSVDLATDLYRDKSKKVGYVTEEYLAMQERTFDYTLLTGKYAVEYMDMIGHDIDFLILDTVHKVPGEILDFLACYPYLKKGAVVVLHDIALNHWNNNYNAIATKLLFDVVTAEKLIDIDQEDFGNKDCLLSIGAFILTEDTDKYIDDLFSAMTITWQYKPQNAELKLYRSFYEKYYPCETLELFDVAVRMNQNILNRKKSEKLCIQQNTFLEVYEWIEKIKLRSGVYVYGCGYYGKRLYSILETCGVKLKGFIISDGQSIEEDTEQITYLSMLDWETHKERDIILIAVDVLLQKEICAELSSRGISEYVLPCHAILSMLS